MLACLVVSVRVNVWRLPEDKEGHVQVAGPGGTGTAMVQGPIYYGVMLCESRRVRPEEEHDQEHDVVNHVEETKITTTTSSGSMGDRDRRWRKEHARVLSQCLMRPKGLKPVYHARNWEKVTKPTASATQRTITITSKL